MRAQTEGTAFVSGRITVVGRAAVAARPDRLEIGLEVTSLEPTPDGALNVVAERSSALDRILDEDGVSEEARTTSGLSLAEEHAWETDREVFRGYRAGNRFVVRFSDPSRLGRVLREATRQAGARIHGPWWAIDPENEAHGEACRRAASDARRKAEAYASSLGLRLGQIVRAKEPRVHGTAGFVGTAAVRSMGLGPPVDEEVDLHPGSLDVTATIEVTFEVDES